MKVIYRKIKTSLKITALIFFTAANMLFSQQINISRIEQMPNMPAPYLMRDWKTVTENYDAFVFDQTKTGDYLPLVSLYNNTTNYPSHGSFKLHTVVGTNSPGAGEAINCLPAVIGASLVGIDKSNQNGNNWVLMCEEWFNKRPEQNVYKNHPVDDTSDDWWYETMPNLFFYQLYDLYPNTGDFAYQFTTVADQWLRAVKALGGNDAPWEVPYMNYRGFNLATMTPYQLSVPEPEAAGAIAWLLYNAYVETGNEEYRIGAEWSMEFLSNWNTNPSYELQLSYGTYIAARMNAELGAGYNLEKMINWCFNIGPLRQWGAIIGTWDGIDVHGLIGESISNDYVFAMNGFEQIGALVPLVRYDDRFARAIGKWVLNIANASRLFYTEYLPGFKQDSEEWANVYDPNSVFAHEAIRETGPGGVSPYATGDAIAGGWGATNLTLYSSSHVGILGGIISETNVEGILQLDVLKTDYFHSETYPSYLYYNPHGADHNVEIDVGTGTHDIYDAVTNSFIQNGVSGQVAINVPADGVVLAVITPAGETVTYNLDHALIDGKVIDYRSGQPVVNYPPRIKSVAHPMETVGAGNNVDLYCTAVDRDGDNLTYLWNATGGTFTGEGNQVVWNAPVELGNYTITAEVNDGNGGSDIFDIAVDIAGAVNHQPVIEKIKATPRKMNLGATSQLTCEAADEDGDNLTYSWSAANGTLSGSGSTVSWISPANAGDYTVSCSVSDGNGGEDSKTLDVRVRDLSITQSGSLVAYYPFTTTANDESGNNYNGTISGAVKTEDRHQSYQKAYYFDGIDDYIKVTNNAGLNFQNAITVNFWIKISIFYAREAYPLSHGNWENRWKLSITNERMRWTLKTDDGIKDLDSESLLETNEWLNITALYSGSDYELWINGELDALSSWTGLIKPSPLDLMFGQATPTNSEYNFKGALDEIRIYDYALSVEEIQNLDDVHTDVDDRPDQFLPTENILMQNYPNPFNNQTLINYQIKETGSVKIYIFDLLGRKVKTLVDANKEPGYYTISWNGINEHGSNVTSGVYFYSMKFGDFTTFKKLLLIK